MGMGTGTEKGTATVDFSVIKETIELNKERLMDSGELVDELLSDDALLALGYNKRHNPLIIHNKDEDYFQWSISVVSEEADNSEVSEEIKSKVHNRILIHTVPLGDTEFLLSKDNLDPSYDYILVTNYLNGRLYTSSDGEPLITLDTPELWGLLSNEGFNKPKICEERDLQKIDAELIKSAIQNKEIASTLLNLAQLSNTDRTVDKTAGLITEVVESYTQLVQAKEELTKLEEELQKRESSIKDVQDRLQKTEQEKQGLSDELSNFNANAQKEKSALEGRIDELRKKVEGLEKQLAEATAKATKAEDSLKSMQENPVGNTEYSDKIAALEAELASTKSQLAESQNIITEITSSSSNPGLSATGSVGMGEEVTKYKKENEELQQKVTQLQEEIANLSATRSSESESTGEGSEELATLKKDNDELHIQIADLQAKLSASAGNSSLANSELQGKYEAVLRELTIEKDKAKLLQESVDTANKKAEELQRKISNSQSIMDENDWHSLEAEYREKISSLTMESLSYKEKAEALQAQIDDMQKVQITAKDVTETLAKSLIDAIEDDPNLERTYVGAVNSKLFQSREIGRFAGICLEELYSLVDSRLLQELYDGTKFKWINPPTQVDFTINNKDYQFDMSRDDDDSLMKKITNLFNYFANSSELDGVAIAFEYKVIGQRTSDLSSEDSHIADEGVSGDKDISKETVSEAAIEEVTVDEEEAVEVREKTSTVQVQEVTPISSKAIEIEEVNLPGTSSTSNKLMSVPLNELGKIVWNPKFTLISIDYIGKGTNILKIKADQDCTICRLAAKSIDALLGLSSNFDEAITLLNQVDLSSISNFITRIEANNRTYPRISFSKFVLNPIDAIGKVVPILTGICEIINENPGDFSIYITATQNVNDSETSSILDEYECGREATVADTVYYTPSNNDEIVDAVISGSITDSVMITRNSLEVHKQIFAEASAIKAAEIGANISNFEGKKKALHKLLSGVNSPVDSKIVGYVLGESYCVLSTIESEVGEEHYSLDVNGTTYYISIMSEWQFIYAIMKVYTVLYKNKKVGIKCKVNKSALLYYLNQFNTGEPSLRIAVRSVAEYISSKNNLS